MMLRGGIALLAAALFWSACSLIASDDPKKRDTAEDPVVEDFSEEQDRDMGSDEPGLDAPQEEIQTDIPDDEADDEAQPDEIEWDGSPMYGGPCNPVEDSGCGEGEVCWIVIACGVDPIEYCELEPGTTSIGETCYEPDNCEARGVCIDPEGGDPRCHRFCVTNDHCPATGDCAHLIQFERDEPCGILTLRYKACRLP